MLISGKSTKTVSNVHVTLLRLTFFFVGLNDGQGFQISLPLVLPPPTSHQIWRFPASAVTQPTV